MVAHQALQRRAVALPVFHPQGIRLLLADAQLALHISRHAAVDVRKNIRRRVVQGVVQIEDPDPALAHDSQFPEHLVAVIQLLGADARQEFFHQVALADALAAYQGVVIHRDQGARP